MSDARNVFPGQVHAIAPTHVRSMIPGIDEKSGIRGVDADTGIILPC